MAMKELALEENVPVINFLAKSKALFQELGLEKQQKMSSFGWMQGKLVIIQIEAG
ncbi:hypothetical protein [Neobacillus dielmonensis]|uniref:hypothetical protein n=1 Tax=Neobacillus dielmonensis TaxID=1347369 RepID=UPI000AAA8436|nr:hypothetical protein [Neobacillus dielmonensis]